MVFTLFNGVNLLNYTTKRFPCQVKNTINPALLGVTLLYALLYCVQFSLDKVHFLVYNPYRR